MEALSARIFHGSESAKTLFGRSLSERETESGVLGISVRQHIISSPMVTKTPKAVSFLQ
jgi:hypothetical protein